MAGKLITLPLRVSFRSARLFTRVAGATASHALSLAGRTIGAVAPARPTPPPAPRAQTRTFHEPPSFKASIETPKTIETPEVAEPVHVSEEPELVREVADPGAEDGAGAAITVAEPWNGYKRMSAKDVIDRARAADLAELAAVRLYESRHRSRQTVLAAVDRQLRLANGGASA